VLTKVSDEIKICMTKKGIRLYEFDLFNILNEQYKIADEEAVKFIVDKNYYGKFLIHSLDDVEKIIYLDADLLILKNIDHLFEQIDISEKNVIHMTFDLMVNTHSQDLTFRGDTFNSGVILCVSNPEITKSCYTLLRDFYCKDENSLKNLLCGDQTIYNHLSSDSSDPATIEVLHLKYRYNCVASISRHLEETGTFRKDENAIIHFTLSPKPWNFVDIENSITGLYIYSDSEPYFLKWVEMYFNMVMDNLAKSFSKNCFHTFKNKYIALGNNTDPILIASSSEGAAAATDSEKIADDILEWF
jgi:lipopolysaccharide biosynthesis glycosyltransferase